MICFDVSVNGRRLAVAGLPDFAVLSAILCWVRSQKRERSPGKPYYESLHFSVGGLDSNSEPGRHVDWARRELGVGDKIQIKIVERESADSYRERKYPKLTKGQRIKQVQDFIARHNKDLRELKDELRGLRTIKPKKRPPKARRSRRR